MGNDERATYLEEERYRVCASGPRGSPVLATATKAEVTQADPCPSRPAHGSVVKVGGQDMVIAYSMRGRAGTRRGARTAMDIGTCWRSCWRAASRSRPR